ncbi:MAG: imelysin family protein [Saprospiraceae bacterium]
MKFVLKLSILSSILILSIGCGDETTEPSGDYKAVITNVSNDVILKTYEDLFNKTESFVTTLNTLYISPTGLNLDAARQAWRDARVPWEQSEGFLFGPVDQKGIDPSIDSWPVNQPDLEAVLNSPNALTKTYIDGLDGTLKGFHTLEFLLFGPTGNKDISTFTPRQIEYLKACAESLHGATQELYFSWTPEQQNYVDNLLKAGEPGNSVYPSQKSVLQEFVNGMISIADEVANGKINDPLVQQNVSFEESRFSANSKQDFADNIRSIRNAYLGTFNTSSGLGLSSVISANNVALDVKVRQHIDAAINAIEAIPGTFTTAIFNDKSSVEYAQEQVRALQAVLESEVLPLISNL